MGLTKDGTGTQSLTGSNTTTGVVTVNGGTLALTGAGRWFFTGAFFGVANTTYVNVNTNGILETDRFAYGDANAFAQLRSNYYSN